MKKILHTTQPENVQKEIQPQNNELGNEKKIAPREKKKEKAARAMGRELERRS